MAVKSKRSGQAKEMRKDPKSRVSELENALVEYKLKAESLEKKEENLLFLLNSMEDQVFLLGLDGTFNRYYQNDAKSNLFLPPKKFLGKHFRDFLPADVGDKYQRALNELEAYGQTQQFDYSIMLNKREHWFGARMSPYKARGGDILGFVLVLRDITRSKHWENRMRDNMEKYRAVMYQSPECVFLADVETRVIIEANPPVERLLGYHEEDIPGLTLYDFIVKNKDDIYQEILDYLKDRKFYIGERKFRKKDGTLVNVEISVHLIVYGNREVFCITARDITPRKIAEKQLAYAATHDPLTGLINRLLFYDRLARELARARRNRSMIALIYIDLDDFKIINDTLGHGAGDQVLKISASRLRSIFRESDTLARMGGDEFMFILADLSKEGDVSTAAGKILEKIRMPIEIEGKNRRITASLGAAVYPRDGENSEDLMKSADLALYHAKKRGRNTCQHYSPEMVDTYQKNSSEG